MFASCDNPECSLKVLEPDTTRNQCRHHQARGFRAQKLPSTQPPWKLFSSHSRQALALETRSLSCTSHRDMMHSGNGVFVCWHHFHIGLSENRISLYPLINHHYRLSSPLQNMASWGDTNPFVFRLVLSWRIIFPVL